MFHRQPRRYNYVDTYFYKKACVRVGVQRGMRHGRVRAVDGGDPGGARAAGAPRPHGARAPLVQLAHAARLAKLLQYDKLVGKRAIQNDGRRLNGKLYFAT